MLIVIDKPRTSHRRRNPAFAQPLYPEIEIRVLHDSVPPSESEKGCIYASHVIHCLLHPPGERLLCQRQTGAGIVGFFVAYRSLLRKVPKTLIT